MSFLSSTGHSNLGIFSFPCLPIIILLILAGIGIAVQYSVAEGHWWPWAGRHAIRFAVALVVSVVIAFADTRFWKTIAYPLLMVAILLLISVEVWGDIGKGAQRWLDLGVYRIQPAEFARLAIVVALAKFLGSQLSEDRLRMGAWLRASLIPVIPIILILRQPDLGMTSLVIITVLGMFFASGMHIYAFGILAGASSLALPIIWPVLHDYQRERVLTFFDPERDPLGAGYHVLQSKIAIGSGGIRGKGFLMSSQGHGDFLPETRTDFPFSVMAEEFGLWGGILILIIFIVLLAYIYGVSLRCRDAFSRLLTLGIAISLFLNIFVNMGMVMGIMPVVGLPLPWISYGGSFMLAMMMGMGMVIGIDWRLRCH